MLANVDGDQVSHSQRFRLYSRAVWWVLWKFFCRREMGSDVCFGKLALLLWGGCIGEGTQGGCEASEETAREIQVRGDGQLDLDRDVSVLFRDPLS